MKKIKLFFTVILFSCLFGATFADDASDIARAAKRVSTTATSPVSIVRGKSENQNPVNLSGSGRAGMGAVKSETIGARTTAIRNNDTETVVEKTRVVRNTVPQNISARTPSVQTRTALTVPRTNSIQAPVARSAINNALPRTQTARAGVNNTAIATNSARSASIARNAITTPDKKTATDYKKCRDVFYSCMDEFCAAKDTQLKRCACSVRTNDFDATKKKLEKVDDKILTFNERLLTVNMDREDAAAISIATAGETAYQKDDKSASKKILDEITKKLKSSTADSKFDQNLSAISLSLDADSAFDNIDSMMGASSTTKSGTALYNAALPICRDMVAEVCDADGAAIAESGYQMAIEQDCNTVAKAYETMNDTAMNKLREGSALLDMSRLDIHQKRNSDDILTCKKKMLDMISSSSVCGTDLGKCLDTTGKYIDPSTGTAFLTVDLINLGNLISRPAAGQKWTTAPGNNSFVLFLNSKRTYLEPAMENCQDISARVWDDFIEDALAQIKLAQEKKLEDMRQGCTALTTQCLSNTAKDISEFDARALSVFGVSADKTVNEMCSGIKTSCTAILNTGGGDAEWIGGISEITTEKTYETIMATCREIGKACIIQTCKSIAGNFGLCENIERSVNRKSIIKRTACWNDVVKCVSSAGTDSITNIMAQLKKNPGKNTGNFYTELYGTSPIITNASITCDSSISGTQNCVYDICSNCGDSGAPDCASCRLAEKIWGNCEFRENTLLKSDTKNMIKIPETLASQTVKTETLLSWFADNTGTTNLPNSCMDTTCPAGQRTSTKDGISTCVSDENFASDNSVCAPNSGRFETTTGVWDNCCTSGVYDSFNNCCSGTAIDIGGIKICPPTIGTVSPVINYKDNTTSTIIRNMICTGTLPAGGNAIDSDDEFPNGDIYRCDESYVIINPDMGIYTSPKYESDKDGNTVPDINLLQTPTYPNNYYSLLIDTNTTCTYNMKEKNWGNLKDDGWNTNGCDKITGAPTDSNNLFIQY